MAKAQDNSPTHFDFDCGDGYGVRFVDYSSAGLLLAVTRPPDQAPYYDREATAMLPSDQVDRFLLCANRTCSRPGMVLPPKTRKSIERILKTGKVSRNSHKVLTQAAASLKNLENEVSRAARAINR